MVLGGEVIHDTAVLDGEADRIGHPGAAVDIINPEAVEILPFRQGAEDEAAVAGVGEGRAGGIETLIGIVIGIVERRDDVARLEGDGGTPGEAGGVYTVPDVGNGDCAGVIVPAEAEVGLVTVEHDGRCSSMRPPISTMLV